MVDTVVIRVKNLYRNQDLVWAVISKTHKVFSKTFLEHSINDLRESSTVMFEKVYHEGKEYMNMERRKMYVPSSHYDVSTQVQTDFIEFNLSIPKYLFGNNIAQFVYPNYEKGFSLAHHMHIINQVDKVYDDLIAFIKEFFEENFYKEYRIAINYDDITIERIDLCFNQIFESEEQARTYLNYIKRFKKPYENLKTDRMQDFSTGISYKGDGYYFKIYHKGDEYEKNDRSKHKSINRVLRKHPSKLNQKEQELWMKVEELHGSRYPINDEQLKRIADRILRYEISFKKRGLSFVYKKAGLASKDPEFDQLRKRWNKLESMRRRKNAREFTSEEYKFHSMFQKVMRRNHDFYPFPAQYIRTKEVNLAWHNENDYTEAFFSKKLFKRLVEILIKYIDHYYIVEQETEETIVQRIRENNERVRSKRDFNKNILKYASAREKRSMTGKIINENKILMYLSMIQKYGSLDLWCQRNGISTRKKRDIRLELDFLGVQAKSVKEPLNFVVSRDYQKYYQLEFTWGNVLRYVNRWKYKKMSCEPVVAGQFEIKDRA